MADLYNLDTAICDDWLRLPEHQPLPQSGRLLLDLERFRRESEALKTTVAAIAVQLPPQADIQEIAAELKRLMMVELVFPSFTDGRAFTQARELRGFYAYKGTIRASGEVLPDQLPFMARCGFDQFELTRQETISMPRILGQMQCVYQSS